MPGYSQDNDKIKAYRHLLMKLDDEALDNGNGSLIARSCGPASRLPFFFASLEISSDAFLISFMSRCTSRFTPARSSEGTSGSLARWAHEGTVEELPPQSWKDMPSSRVMTPQLVRTPPRRRPRERG